MKMTANLSEAFVNEKIVGDVLAYPPDEQLEVLLNIFFNVFNSINIKVFCVIIKVHWDASEAQLGNILTPTQVIFN